MTDGTSRAGGRVFTLVVGFLVGVLFAAVAIPDHGGGGVDRTGVDAVDSSGAAGSDPGGTAGTSVGGDAGAGAPGGDAASGEGPGDPGATTGAAVGGGPGGPAADAPADGSAPAAARGSSASGPATVRRRAGAARGVTSSEIVLGVAYPDLGALKALGPEYDNGDVAAQWRALVAGWERDKVTPIAGRRISLRFATYNVVDLTDQRRACAQLVDDDKVFAVIAVAYFAVGAECVAREKRTPLITTDGPRDQVFARSAPFLFSLQMGESRMLRNWLRWAEARGALKGRKIGLYYLDDVRHHDVMATVVKPTLAKLGHRIAAESTTDQSLGGPGDAVAVQRFRSAGVDLALLFTSRGGFLQQAEAQRYRPTYMESDFDFGTSDTTTSNYPPEAWSGTFGYTGRRVGEQVAGAKLEPSQEACIANYERVTGDRVARPGSGGHETAEFAYILQDCDLGDVLLAALRAAGRELDATNLVTGLESIRDLPARRFPSLSFGPNKHDGANAGRTVQWQRPCTCWKAMTPFVPAGP